MKRIEIVLPSVTYKSCYIDSVTGKVHIIIDNPDMLKKMNEKKVAEIFTIDNLITMANNRTGK